MAVHQKMGSIVDYCHKIRDLCRNELDSRAFASKLIEILKNLNEIKQKANLKLSIYIITESDDK
ncbi:MAG: hypothetical protein ACXAEX_09405 [Promethearchaeota archaeon]|jgi:hypothetical protein